MSSKGVARSVGEGECDPMESKEHRTEESYDTPENVHAPGWGRGARDGGTESKARLHRATVSSVRLSCDVSNRCCVVGPVCRVEGREVGDVGGEE